MIDVQLEMTKGDPFYHEIAFVDAAGAAIDLTGWGIKVDFKARLTDTTPIISLTVDNGGIEGTGTGLVAVQFEASAFDALDINPRPRNGETMPSATIYGDVRILPPPGVHVAQGMGCRTVILLRVYAGVTA